MNNASRFLVTSALPYANGPLHVGHLAGAYLPADLFVRYLRLCGKDVKFICGSDENGAAITMRARKEGISPREIVDKYHDLFKKTFEKAGISFDVYHRTSSALHHETARDFFRKLYNDGSLVEKTTEQYYDTEAGQFLADRYIQGTCPRCGHEEAYGDQCESCGATLSPTDLINPKSTLSGSEPELRKTNHWYLPLDQHEAWLREWIEKGELFGKKHHYPEDWKNHVLGQCKSWLDSGLEPRAMTRDLEWGVDVPEEIPGSEGKKLYVWLDAPIGYISATREWARQNKKGEDWKKYWQDDESALIHFIGKDNIVFHCLIFPVILKLYGNFILPDNVPANQFMNLEGRKISTSKNWAVWVHEFVETAPEYVDVLRYYMIRNMPEQRDSEFTWDGFQEAANNELVNTLANFIHRVLVLSDKYYGGVVPEYDEDEMLTDPEDEDGFTYVDAEMLRIYDYLYEIHASVYSFNFRNAQKAIMDMAAYGNQLLQNNAPWKHREEEPEMVKALMFLCNQLVAAISLGMHPFMPQAAGRLREMINQPPIEEKGELKEAMDRLAEGDMLLESGHELGKAEHLFTRIPDEWIQDQKDKLGQKVTIEKEEEMDYEALKDTIQFDDFVKLDMRTGTIVEAEAIEKADKLLKLKVDLGFEQRTVVSGIAQHFEPEEIVGNRVSVVVNLAPRKIMGVMSQGMILMAEDTDGKLTFVSPPENADNGMVIR